MARLRLICVILDIVDVKYSTSQTKTNIHMKCLIRVQSHIVRFFQLKPQLSPYSLTVATYVTIAWCSNTFNSSLGPICVRLS